LKSSEKELKNMHRASTVSQISIRLRGKAVPGAEDRQRKIAGFDQDVFSKSSILCIGAGGLISHIAPTLVRKGTGEWLRGQTEHCLLAARGKPVFIHGSYTTVLRASRREHSRKPDEFYTLVEDTCPGSRLELFARQARAGWQAFGDQTALFSGHHPAA
jgi:hypothetical protein